jgi:hypothetical protein
VKARHVNFKLVCSTLLLGGSFGASESVKYTVANRGRLRGFTAGATSTNGVGGDDASRRVPTDSILDVVGRVEGSEAPREVAEAGSCAASASEAHG